MEVPLEILFAFRHTFRICIIRPLMDKLISDHPNAIIRTYSMRILRTLETDAKKSFLSQK